MLRNMIIDTHCHIYFDKFSEDLDDVVARGREAGVEKMISIGCDVKTSKQSVDLAKKYDGVYATVGLHPCYLQGFSQGIFDEYEKMVKGNEEIVAVGECGLDYYNGDSSDKGKRLQHELFEKQIDLAKRMDLPLVIHNREADEDCFEILLVSGADRVVFHCFGGDLEFARRIWDQGWMTSFTGIVTYPNAGDLREVAKQVPMDLFMVETDAPFLAPQGHRGKRNEPAYVVEVVEKIAEIKGLDVGELVSASTENAREFFRF